MATESPKLGSPSESNDVGDAPAKNDAKTDEVSINHLLNKPEDMSKRQWKKLMKQKKMQESKADWR